ncbi:MAG TPA: WD40 repeat domain-containing protein [Candidatus Polarisedimenticolaceae bacterium]|nr:WD40 repeat domain-containing protein [Candidatus Polarisedimenticolaceae bacterium]
MRSSLLLGMAVAAAGAVRFATAPDGEEAARMHPWMLAAAGLLLLLAVLLAPFRRTRPMGSVMVATGAFLLPVYTLTVVGLHAMGAVRWPDPAAELIHPEPIVDRTLRGHGAHVWSLDFSPDGRFLVSGSVDGTARIWKVDDGSLFHSLQHPVGVTAVAFGPDGQTLATGSYDGPIRLWDLTDGRLSRELKGHQGTVWSLAFHPSGHLLASGGNDTTVRLWRVTDGASVRSIQAHRLIVWSVAFSPDGEHLASGSFDHDAKLWRVKDGRPLWKAWGDLECVYGVAFSPDGSTIASGSRDKSAIHGFVKEFVGVDHAGRPGDMIRLWRARDGALLTRLSGHREDVHAVRFSPDGRHLATAGVDGNVVLWRLSP